MPVFRLLGAEHKPVFTYATGGYYVEGAKPTACADELAGFIMLRALRNPINTLCCYNITQS